GADVRLTDDGFDIGIRKSWEQALEDVEAEGGRPYAIPAGASVHKFGGLGYVGFAKDGRQRKVIGIDASATPKQTKAQVLDIARKTAKLVELGNEIAEDDV